MALTPISFNKTKTSIFAKSAAQDPNTVYFAQDDHRIYLDTIPYDQDSLVHTTYYELNQLMEGRLLIPGCFYRITDYNCTTTQEHTQSANHPFDIIVRADSIDTLNEDAWAALHEGDTYFRNSNLQAWKLKYSIKNDTNRFAWANNNARQTMVQHIYDITFSGLINPTKDQAILDMANRQVISGQGSNYEWAVNSVTCHLNGFTTNLSSDVSKFVLSNGDVWTSSKRLGTPVTPSSDTVYMTITVPQPGVLNIAVKARSTAGNEYITIKNGSGDIILNNYDIVANVDKKTISLPDGSTGYYTIVANLPAADTYKIEWSSSGSSKLPYFYALIYDMQDPELPVIDHPEFFGADGFYMYCTDTNHKHIQDYSESGVLFGTATSYKRYHYRHSTQGSYSSSNSVLLALPHPTGTLRICARTGSSSTPRHLLVEQSGVILKNILLDDNDAVRTSAGKVFPIYSVDLTSDADITIKFLDGNIGLYNLEFEWDETVTTPGGKGVVYYMKDEHNNEAPYDFKNIMFARWKTSGQSGETEWMNGHYYSMSGEPASAKYFFTFSGNSSGNEESTQKDLSISQAVWAYSNIIYPKYGLRLSDYDKRILNNIVFLQYSSVCGWDDNIIHNDCTDITIGGGSCGNEIDTDSSNIGLAQSNSLNNIGTGSYVFLGERCQYNHVGISCAAIYLGNDCQSNNIGKWCETIRIDYESGGNTIGQECNNISLGTGGAFNTIESGCDNIHMGAFCRANHIGKECRSINFGNGDAIRSHYQNILVETGNRCLNIESTGANRSLSNPFRNIIIGLGVNNSNTWKTITNSELGQTYETRYVSDNSKTITI